MKQLTLLILSTLLLSACMNANTTGIQRGYVTMRDTCRTQAEGQLAYAQATDRAKKDVSETLAQLFSDCMEKKGWAVASTKSRPGKAPPLDSIYDLPQTPGGRGPAASVAAAEQRVVPQPQIIQPDYRGLSPQQQQALYQQHLQQQQALQQQYQQPQVQPQQYYQQPQTQQYYQQQYYQQPQYAPQSYYEQEKVEPIQHSATSLHLSRGGRNK